MKKQHMKEKYIKSLHRPYNSRLKTVKWVCEFTKSNDNTNVGCFLYEFYLYLVTNLHKTYLMKSEFDSFGLPSKETIKDVYDYLNQLNKEEQITAVKDSLLLSKNKDKISKKIYSTYKAASYFVTLAKKEFNLIDKRNRLSTKGNTLLAIRNIDFISLSSKECHFFLGVIIDKDLLLFLTQMYFNHYKEKYYWSSDETADMTLTFLLEYYHELKSFQYTKKSISNYMVVRSRWIEDLDIKSKKYILRPFFKKMILESSDMNIKLYDLFTKNILEFHKINIKNNELYKQQRTLFIKFYKKLCEQSPIYGFDYVNIYALNKLMHLSYPRMQLFLEQLTNDKEYKYKVHCQNIVSSIDGRKRYWIRNSQVITIRIEGI